MLMLQSQHIQDRNLELADSLLDQIWERAVYITDENESNVVKYFAEALVRRAHGLHPPVADFYLQHPLIYFGYYDDSFGRIDRDALMEKRQLHIIDFYVPLLYGFRYLFYGLRDYFSGYIVPVRVSVILPPFLEESVDVQQEKQYLTVMAKDFGAE